MCEALTVPISHFHPERPDCVPQDYAQSHPREAHARGPGVRLRRLARDRPGAARRLVGRGARSHQDRTSSSPGASADGDDYSGAYWTGTDMAVVEDLGPDP